MSLTPKRRTTEKSSAANRANGRKSRGAVTPAGQGSRCQSQFASRILCASAERSAHRVGGKSGGVRRAHEFPENNLAKGLEGELVQCIGDTLWRMKRAGRMQNGLAAKRVQSGLEKERLIATPMLLHINAIYEGLCAIGRMLNRDDSTPAPGETRGLRERLRGLPAGGRPKTLSSSSCLRGRGSEGPHAGKRKRRYRADPFDRRGTGKGSGAPAA